MMQRPLDPDDWEATLNGLPNLPAPRRVDRWQPLRCGLLNIYRYDEEEFRFEQGRLLLRGDNGTGKSRVLALQLPFLLDGDVSPSRVEPDGDPAKRIEWHLLMGRWPDRTGYTWIEFGKRTPDGRAEFLTFGCGMRAVAGHSGLHSRWFFMARGRLGPDFQLQSDDRRPHGRERLEQALEGKGRVMISAEEYRRAVDDSLFGLGPRYGRLVDLLIRLRRPKLSQKLDEEELSATLSEALPVLSSSLVEEVAEAFRSLESDRNSLRGFVETRHAVEEFLREYAVYARIAVRRRATAVRAAHSQYEEAQRAVRDAERRVAESEARLAEIEAARESLERDQAATEEAIRTLRASPEMQTAAELDHAEQVALASASARDAAQSDVERARDLEARARGHLEQARIQHAEVTVDARNHLSGAEAAATASGLADVHGEQLGGLTLGDTSVDVLAVIRVSEPELKRVIHQRREGLDHLERLEREIEAARRAWDTSEITRQRALDACSAARDAERTAREALERAVDAFRGSLEAWRGHLSILPQADLEGPVADFESWIETREGPNPWRLLAESVHRRIVAELMERLAEERQVIAVESSRISEVRAELESLVQGRVDGPPVLPGRRADRTGRLGAPLWRICDFRSDTPEEVRAGLEAALEASGLLDAWLLPDGRLVDPDTEDTLFLVDDGLTAERAGTATSLARWLVVARDPGDRPQEALSVDRIGQVLRAIGGERDQGLHWVAPDGSWRLGPLTGRWTKRAASYIGEGSRAEARRRRIEELRGELAARESEQERRSAQLRRLESARASADSEWQTFPDDRPILEMGIRSSVATAAIAEAIEAHEEAERETARCRNALEQAEVRYHRDAADLRMSEWRGRLGDFRSALSDYVSRLSALWPTLRLWQSSAGRLDVAQGQWTEARVTVEERHGRHRLAAEAAAAAASRREMLTTMHGATVAVVLESLRRQEQAMAAIRQSLQQHQKEQVEQAAARAAAVTDHDHARHEQHRHDESRQAAIRVLETFAGQRLLPEAHPELASVEAGPWAVTRAVEIARGIEPLLAGTPAEDATWQRRQDSIHLHIQELRDRLLAGDHQPETHQVEDLVLVRCRFQTRLHTMTELRDAFGIEIHERERLLEAREREIIENHLLGEIAVELQRFVRGAEEWIASANRELAARPTSTGLRFRFVWEPALEGAFAEVRKAFLKTSELWSPSERAAITRFLQERIRAEQVANDQGSWRDHLGAALDYRRWHRFLVERQQEGVWRRLDKRTYGTGSGGEKALALTLPRFAAAAAHYRSARPDAPRLVMLDEAFAGIDPTMRAQCMGMLAQFDLDVVMTSELEWGCYPTVPGLAIYHLTTCPGIDAVASTLWIWNGRERRRGLPE